MSVNKKLLKDFDFSLVVNIIMICAVGIVLVCSSTHAFWGGSPKTFITQIIWTVIGLVLMVVTAIIDYENYKVYYKVIYLANLCLLGLVIVLGKVVNGANSWLGVGGLGIQPSEFMKVSLIIMLAKKIEDFDGDVNNFKNLSILFLYSVPPLVLIMLQPDLGTAMVFVAIIIGMLFLGGLNLKVFIVGIVSMAAVALGVWFSPVQILEPYQKARVLTFFNPEMDPQGDGYHIIQSKLAIGSGKLFGMGFGRGLQNEGKYLPESSTDFIFSVLGEEFGFIGTAVLILLYGILIFKCLKITKRAKDKFGVMVIAGVVSMLIFQVFQNIGMTIGLMPITGITLPFVSYGGSSMLTSMIAMGLVLNIGMRRHKINF